MSDTPDGVATGARGGEIILRIDPIEDGFRLDGELDMATADDLGAALRAAMNGSDQVLLDFAGVTFMDSSGLRVLLEAASGSNGKGQVVLLHPGRQVRRVLDVSIPGGTPGLEVRP